MQLTKFILWVPVLLLALSLLNVTTGAAEKEQKPRKGKLQHVVCLKFKTSANQEQINELVTAFAALEKKIKEIKAFEWGTNVSPEQHDKGFTHCFVATFKTAKARDAYLVHPEHKEFVKLVGPIVEDVFVIDYWAE